MSDKKPATTTKQIATSATADTVPPEVIEALGGAPIPPPPAPPVRAADVTLGQPAGRHRAGPVLDIPADRPRRDRQPPATEQRPPATAEIADIFRVPANPGEAEAAAALLKLSQAATAAHRAITDLVAATHDAEAINGDAEEAVAARLGIDCVALYRFAHACREIVSKTIAAG